MSKKINFLKSISLIVFFIAIFNMTFSAYACSGGHGGNDHKKKITICHFQQNGRPKEITINNNDLLEHLAHGDHVGKCTKEDYAKWHGHKIMICHIPPGNPENAHEIWVSKKALKAHLAHGDYIGKCTTEEPPVCGNNLLQTGEQCDDGNLLNDDGCSAICKLEVCGDNVKQTNEQCDDGNLLDYDGCSSSCKIEVCGDNVKQTNEECDDGNLLNDDGCSMACKLEVCGDGAKQLNEQCDDGNLTNEDGCDSVCKIEELFAKGQLTAITKDSAQKGEAYMNIATNTYAQMLVTCTNWDTCVLKLVRSAKIAPYEFSATFDTGILSSEVCDSNGVCTANSTFVVPENPNPQDPQAISMTFAFTDTAGVSGGEAIVSLDPDRDKLNVMGSIGVTDATGALMTTMGEVEASVESTSKTVNLAKTSNGAASSLSQSSIVAYEHSVAEGTNEAVASGAGAISASNDTVGANVNATVNHAVRSNGTGANAVASCNITSDSNGASTATLDALSQDGLQTADSVNHLETLIDPYATVTVTADCGDVQF